MKRVILTGGTGFVGANLARRLVGSGHEVHLLVRGSHTRWRIEDLADDLRLHQVDLEDEPAVAGVVRRVRPDWIFHLAAYGAYSWESDLDRMVRTNLTATMHLVDACVREGFESFINTGSSSEYGFKDHPPEETERLEPNSDYAVTKAAATLYCCHAARAQRVNLHTLRLYSVYGPYEEPRRLIPALVTRGLSGELPPLAGPDTARDYVHVDDVSEAYLLAAGRPGQEGGEIYNVGTGIQTSLREAVATARRIMGIAAEPAWGSLPARSWDTDVWVSNSRKIRERLGWSPRYPFAEGLAATVAWFREDPARTEFYRRSAAPV